MKVFLPYDTKEKDLARDYRHVDAHGPYVSRRNLDKVSR